MIVKVKEIEFDISGKKRAEYELTFTEYTARLLLHRERNRKVVFRSNNCVSVICDLSTYNYIPIVKE